MPSNHTLFALMGRVAEQERALEGTRALAPHVPGGALRVRVGGLVHTVPVRPRDFEGWGIFTITRDERGHANAHVATLEAPATLPDVDAYLGSFPSLRVWLVAPLAGRAWLAMPANRAESAQRHNVCGPLVVRLVHEGRRFERVLARCVGGSWWMHELDLRADPLMADTLRDALHDMREADTLRIPGLTPEQRAAYALAFYRDHVRAGEQRARQDHARLTTALAQAGGTLHDYTEHEDMWLVRWTAPGGAWMESAIARDDLTVLSAGMCLSGEDEKFDLQSLVGVVEDAGW